MSRSSDIDDVSKVGSFAEQVSQNFREFRFQGNEIQVQPIYPKAPRHNPNPIPIQSHTKRVPVQEKRTIEENPSRT